MAFPTALVINLGGYMVGAALYGMLVALVLAPPHGAAQRATPPGWTASRRLALMVGLLGVVWNVGAVGLEWFRAAGAPAPAWLAVAAYAALGFLPAVVVHLVLDSMGPAKRSSAPWLRWIAILVAAVAAGRQVHAAWTGALLPDPAALLLLTWGFTALVAALLVMTRHAPRSRTLWVAALAVFAVSGLHLTSHVGTESWWMALIGHQASLPLGIAILQQHDRFAFADVFLRRALALLLLGAVVLGVLLVVPAVPVVPSATEAPAAFVLWVAVWMAVAVSYPALQVVAGRVVDRFVLERPDHAALRRRLAGVIADAQDGIALWQRVTRELDLAFDTTGVWHRQVEGEPPGAPIVMIGGVARTWMASEPRAGDYDAVAAVALVPTVESPYHAFGLPALADGRRLLSDDIDLLQTTANLVGRRVDALRVAHERCEQSLREEEISRLATEAELRALRAQLNPHFLFNALTTIGYLIQAAPDRAERTLMDLTGVLRAVLRRSSHEFSTLGDEIELIRAYLDIECARFEERLHVEVDVDAELRRLSVPSLLLQPLVENAVKHGIAPSRVGGRVTVRAFTRIETLGPRRLVVEIEDTGVGGTPGAIVAGRAQGLGLSSVERRLQTHYGAAGQLSLASQPGAGTRVVVIVPIGDADASDRTPLSQVESRG